MSEKARALAMTDATEKVAIICADIAGYPYQVSDKGLHTPDFAEAADAQNDASVTENKVAEPVSEQRGDA